MIWLMATLIVMAIAAVSVLEWVQLRKQMARRRERLVFIGLYVLSIGLTLYSYLFVH
jgi:hypothetical protein